MPEPIILEVMSPQPIYLEALVSSAPSVVALAAIPGPPGPLSLAKTSIAVTIDGAGAVIMPGDKADLPVPFDGVIVGWQALAFPAGNVTVDILKTPFSDFPHEPADSITAGAPIVLTGASKAEGNAATWLTGLSEGDVLRYVVETNSVIRRLTVALFVERD